MDLDSYHFFAVWQIVTSEEEVSFAINEDNDYEISIDAGLQMESAIEHITLIQGSYPSELVQLCLDRPVQQIDGIWMPQRFGNVKENGSFQMKTIASSKAIPALIEMSSMVSNIPNLVLVHVD